MQHDRELVPKTLLDVDATGHERLYGSIVLCDRAREFLLLDLPIDLALITHDVELFLFGLDGLA